VTMFRSSTVKIMIILLVSSWVIGCSSTPENELVDIDNVMTQKQKKEMHAQAKMVEKANLVQSSNVQSATPAPNKPVYPIVTPAPIMRPITVPNPVTVAKEPSESEQGSRSTGENSKNV